MPSGGPAVLGESPRQHRLPDTRLKADLRRSLQSPGTSYCPALSRAEFGEAVAATGRTTSLEVVLRTSSC